ncbi:antibiotic biosynthesis monooxygenase [Marinomonas sp. C2222]|uniref:Antibiotic biosynthesis monooxygenase n=1 Tax=Marinomonas sargassi TaxID=2984494 RepID=A0ABT2YPN5_9GAMM|nr:antibiotic biosynthesis monooxygenase [Marinomonas sargassi]MCV2401860.1 antibiotic biosynthesis monooxygenase [Marinomonas sargassi]
MGENTTGKVILSGHIEVTENELEVVLTELPNHMALTQQEEGCLVFKVERCKDDPCCFSVYEEFESQAAFDKHQTRVKSSYWGEITKNVKRFYSVKQE